MSSITTSVPVVNKASVSPELVVSPLEKRLKTEVIALSIIGLLILLVSLPASLFLFNPLLIIPAVVGGIVLITAIILSRKLPKPKSLSE